MTTRELPLRRFRVRSPIVSTQRRAHRSAAQMLPERPTIACLRDAAAECERARSGSTRCRPSSAVVIRSGDPRDRVLLVGEQPGHEEDLAGEPSSILRAPDAATRERGRLGSDLRKVASVAGAVGPPGGNSSSAALA